MKKQFLSLLIISLTSVGLLQAQDHSSGSTSHTHSSKAIIILYDPIFWKDQLGLSIVQQRKIDGINVEFYEKIKTTYTDSGKQTSHQSEIENLLYHRSEQIWSTFHHRQKRKWEKLDSINSFRDESHRTQSAF